MKNDVRKKSYEKIKERKERNITIKEN